MIRSLFKRMVCLPVLVCMLAFVLSLSACGSSAGSGSDGTEGTEAQAESAAAGDENADAQEDSTAAGDEAGPAVNEWGLEDGVYTAKFETDSNMFHLNEADDGRGVLTVKDGQMTIHIHLPSKNIVNLYAGLKEDAQKEGAELIQPTTDVVTYSDGMTGEVYGFDVPVPAIDEEFDVAVIGTHGNWYDHKVKVTDPRKQ